MELQVVFSYSARAGLLQALGPDTAIARLSDDLSVGPINPVTAATRRAWTDDNIGYDNPDITEDDRAFWPYVLDPAVSRVAWFSRRNAHEYCGFLEYLQRLGGLPTEVVDVTNAKTEDGTFFRGVANIPAPHIPQAGNRRPLTAQERSTFAMLWDQIRAEDGALRVVTDDGSLASAPMSFYDEGLLELVGAQWRSMARILGDAFDRWPVSDLFLRSRLYALEGLGLLIFRDTGARLPEVKRAQI